MLYISRKYRFLYYRIPKTASSSMALALKPYLYPINTHQLKGKSVHITPSESLNILERMNILITDDFKMLMVIRHPYTRIMSLYNYLRDELIENKIDNFDCFLDLLEARHSNDSSSTNVPILKSSGGVDLTQSQLIWTHDPNIFNLNIIKYEELDANTISNYLGIPSFILPEENRSLIPAEHINIQSYQKKKYTQYIETSLMHIAIENNQTPF